MDRERTGFTTYPISCHDLEASQSATATYGFIVDGLLHRLRLKNALERLVVGRWTILGARIGKNKQGQFEYRVPSTFDEEVEAFTFDTQTLSTPLVDHFQLPTPTAQPSISVPSVSTIFEPPAHLRHDNLSLYESSSQPILHLQVVQFSDEKTSVGLTIPQCFCDAGGMKEILSAWSCILSKGGIADNVPAIVEDTVILEKIVPEIGGNDVLAPKSLWTHYLPSQVPANSSDENSEADTRWLFMPAETLTEMTRECRNELTSDTERSDIQVNEAEVLLAWWVKTVYSTNLPEAQYPPIAVSIPLNIRNRLPTLANRTYLHNAIHMATCSLPSSSSLAEIPLSRLASTFRQTMLRATSLEIAHTLAYKTQIYYHSTDDHSTFATHVQPGSENFVLSNWLDMDWALEDCIDFRPALMDRINLSQSFATKRVGRGGARPTRTAAEKIGSGKIMWTDVTATSGATTKTSGIVVRKDEEGVWVTFSLAKWRWTKGLLAGMSEANTL